MYKKHEVKKLYYTIGEVSEITRIPESKIRFWDSEINMGLFRSIGNKRKFTQKQIEKLFLLKKYDNYLTVKGKKMLFLGLIKIS